ncbi:MAG: RagB/SusD family nutrient uptake outer membrane protein, partial [Paludibacteraceae bacterium]|nr:RagB/SusD family nutrient uptake outer membrane protein [Paludibacteraceae bacterium]
MKKLGIFILAAIALMGCKNGEGFLDHEPDMRAHIDTKEKVRLLLVSAYTRGNSAAVLEFSSDNIIDNNAPDAVGHCRKLMPLDKMYDEIFAWKQVVSGDQQDSPKYLWDSHYMAIAAANEALLAIAQLEEQGINMNAEKGEALLIRAYHHFLLSMVFCHAYKTPEL